MDIEKTKESTMKNVYFGILYTLAICVLVAGSVLLLRLLPG